MRYYAILGLLLLAAGATADQVVVWDNGPFDLDNAAGNGKGTQTYFGQVDLQVADDFEVSPPGWVLTGGHFEGLCFFGNLQVDYITVEFFNDGGNGLPQETPFYSVDSYDFTESDYYDPSWGYYHVDFDVEYQTAYLAPGVYWVKMQPYGLYGDWFYQGGTTQTWGNTCANRDGPWGYGYGSQTWIHYSGYDVNFQLTEYLVPEPGVVSVAGLLLGAGALWLRRK
jgi:hypothetical protein